jgi:hypothetical protein
MLSPGYIAGILDSDGSLAITKRHVKRKNPNYTCIIQITWLESKFSSKVIKEMVKLFGGSYFIGKTHSGFGSKKPIIKYCATGKAVEKILAYCGDEIKLKSRQRDNLLKCRELVKIYEGRVRSNKKSTLLENLHKVNRKQNANPKV